MMIMWFSFLTLQRSTVFDLITAHTHISAQSSNSVVFRLQPVYFLSLLYRGICCVHSFELHWQVNAIQMSTHNICFYEEVDKKYTGCNLKTMKLLDCALIGVCAVIRWNTVWCLCIKSNYGMYSIIFQQIRTFIFPPLVSFIVCTLIQVYSVCELYTNI